MEKMAKILPDLFFKNKKKPFELPDFYDKFQKVAKSIKGFWFFSTFISSL
jgi:hypothetical protein